MAPDRHPGPVGGLGQQADRHAVELGVELEPHRPGLAGRRDDGLGVVAAVVLDRGPAQPLHRERGRLPVDHAAVGLHRPEAVEEEAPTGHQLHRIDPGRGLEAGHPGEQRRGIVAHVAHRRDALGQQIAEVEAELLAGAAAREEEQVHVAVDQAGDQVLAAGPR